LVQQFEGPYVQTYLSNEHLDTEVAKQSTSGTVIVDAEVTELVGHSREIDLVPLVADSDYGHSVQDTFDKNGKKLVRQRNRDVTQWKREKSKQLRRSGMSYVSNSGVTMPARTIKPVRCRCRLC